MPHHEHFVQFFLQNFTHVKFYIITNFGLIDKFLHDKYM